MSDPCRVLQLKQCGDSSDDLHEALTQQGHTGHYLPSLLLVAVLQGDETRGSILPTPESPAQ